MSGLPGRFRTPSTCATALGTSAGSASSAKLHQPDAVAIRIHHFGGHLQREPGLADAADADQRQQPGARQQPLDLDQLPLAADERRQRLGQIRVLAARR